MVSLTCGLYGERSTMEAAPHDQEEVMMTTTTAASKDQQALVVKGKRTKRQRPQSPLPFAAAIPTNSSVGNSGAGTSSENDDNTYSPSPVTSAENIINQDSAEEEDQDMANCLILLAQGQSRRSSPKPLKQVQYYSPPPPPIDTATATAAVEDNTGGISAYNNYSSKRKFLEANNTQAAAPMVNNKAVSGAGYNSNYAYECKTCNRSFPSFQALGGHRASHKKPKQAMADNHHNQTVEIKRNNNHQLFGGLPSDDEDQTQFIKKVNNSSTALSLQLSNNNNNNNRSSTNLYGSGTNFVTKASKVHECSICGAEFTSGQALGGHMRRHRAPAVSGSTTTTNHAAQSWR
ncbi:hypothetical protein CsatB_011358 [Cannabis sativa]